MSQNSDFKNNFTCVLGGKYLEIHCLNNAYFFIIEIVYRVSRKRNYVNHTMKKSSFSGPISHLKWFPHSPGSFKDKTKIYLTEITFNPKLVKKRNTFQLIVLADCKVQKLDYFLWSAVMYSVFFSRENWFSFREKKHKKCPWKGKNAPVKKKWKKKCAWK